MPGDIPNRISVASLWAEDVDSTVRFYRDVLGLTLCQCAGGHMEPPHFDVGGGYLAILRGRTVPAPDAQVFPLIALAVDDLDAAVDRLKAQGVELLKDIDEDSTSRWVFLRDPGGNLIELAFWK